MSLGIRNSVARCICVIMLLLIQFDAYGYQMFENCWEVSTEVTQNISDDTLTISEDSPISEWTDPFYNTARDHARSLIRLFAFIALDFCFLQFYCSKSVTQVYKKFEYFIFPQKQHIVYCTYRI